jgi:hypothetical protein
MSSSTFIGLAAMLLEARGRVKENGDSKPSGLVKSREKAYILGCCIKSRPRARKGEILLVRLRAVGTCLLLLSAPAFPQELGTAGPSAPPPAKPPEAVAFIVPRPQGAEKDAPFLRVLATAMRIGLASHGLDARMPEELHLPALAAAPLGRLLQEAAGADFLILEGYTSSGQIIHMEVEVLRVRDGARLASASTSRRIDLRLDEAVDTVVARLLPQMEPYVAEAVRERQQAAAASAPPEPLPSEQPAAGPEPLPEGVPAQPPAPRPDRRMEFGACGATFFPMAELDALFRLGYLAEAYLDYRLRRSAYSLALGVYAGFAGFVPAQQDTASFFDLLVPVGLDLRLGSPERSRLGVHARVQAGAALNVSSQQKVDQRLTRVLPQVKAGAGVSFALTPRMGLSLDFLYELLLYMYTQGGALTVEPIMGFNVPSISYYFRW